jgi:type IV pilus assembly protein PilY1
MADGNWWVIVSGGYNNGEPDGFASGNYNAFLFFLRISGPTGTDGAWQLGTDYFRIDTGFGSFANPNGLAQPFAADIDSDGLVDFIYAGDLRGNLWKFDVRGNSPANWTLAQNRVILFVARDAGGNRQPITAQAEGTAHITGTGFMINFGTGKYIEDGVNADVSPPGPAYTTQSYYGIWDKNDGLTVSTQTTVPDRSVLLEQQVLADVSISGRLAHVTSNSVPNWTDVTNPPTHLGWFIDWANSTPDTTTGDKSPATGERSIFTPQIINGRLIFTTLIPNAQTCLFGGDSVTMVLDNQTGSRFDASPFDISGDGQFNTSDLVTVPGVGTVAVSGISSGIGITGSPTVIKFGSGVGAGGATPGEYLGGYVGGSGSGAALYNTWLAILSGSSASTASVLLDLGANSIGRLNWREVTSD